MTNREAIKIIHTEQGCVRRNWKENCDRNCGECDLVMDAEQTMEAYDMAISALEKQEPKERIMPNSDDILDGIEYHCPNCGRAYKQNSKYDFCIKCGQALLWK